MANKIVSGYKKHPGLYSTAIGVTAVICVVGGYYGYKKVTKPKPVTPANVVQTQAPVSSTTQTLAVNYNGTYIGSGTATQGLTGATVTVVGKSLSGPAIYKGTYLGQTNTVGVNVVGTVSEKGTVSGTFSGTGSIMGQSVKVNGTVTGTITGSTMNCSWKATAFGTSTSGKITLAKK